MFFKRTAVIMAAVAAFGAVSAYGGETEVCRELSRRETGVTMEILTPEIDWSCHDQSDGGQLHSDRFCIWQGQSVPGDGNASYYMAHSYTDWGKQIAALTYDDVITVDGYVYVVDEITPLWYVNEQWIFDYCVPKCYNGSGDGIFLQTCIHNEYGDIVIVHASPDYGRQLSVVEEEEEADRVSSDILTYADGTDDYSDGLIEIWGH